MKSRNYISILQCRWGFSHSGFKFSFHQFAHGTSNYFFGFLLLALLAAGSTGVSAGGVFLLAGLEGLAFSTSFLSRNCFDFLGKPNVLLKVHFQKIKLVRPWPDFHFSRICPTCPEGSKKQTIIRGNVWV